MIDSPTPGNNPVPDRSPESFDTSPYSTGDSPSGRLPRIGFWFLDLASKEFLWSAEIYALHGLPLQQRLTLVEALAFYVPEHRSVLMGKLEECGRAGTSFDLELPLVIAHAQRLWVRIIGEAMRDVSGRIFAVQGACQDITERRRTEAALRASERQFASAFIHAPIGMALVALSGAFIRVNRALCQMLDYTEDELLGLTVQVLTRPDDIGLDLVHAASLLEGKAVSYQIEKRYFHKDGHDVWVFLCVSLVRDEDGEPLHFIAQIQDISRRKADEENTERALQRLYEAQRIGRIGDWDFDLATRVITWSPEVYVLTGRDPALGPPKDEEDNLGHYMPESRVRLRAAVERAITTGEPQEYEVVIQRPDGSRADAVAHAIPHKNAEGRVISLHGTIQDITERKELERQFLRNQRMESLGTLAGGIAHDLNNLLTPISMGVDLLRQLPVPPQSLPVIETIKTSSQRGAELVRQVLTFARGVEGARIALCPKPILVEVAAMARNTFPKNITIELSIDSDLGLVLADPTQVNQAVLNLMVNARDALPSGGRIQIAADNHTLDASEADFRRDRRPGAYIRMRVTDNGAGMAPEIVERVCEPFFTTKKLGQGTGLGLSTVSGIVRNLGGFLDIESKLGEGSTFTLHLPAYTADSVAMSPSEAPVALPRGKGELLLVVDDESSIISLSRSILEEFGYRVLTAEDGAQAAELYVRHQGEIALVITDMMMPVMDGPALIRRLRSLQPDVKILAASGLQTTPEIILAAGLVERQLLPKPYSAEALVTRVRQALMG